MVKKNSKRVVKTWYVMLDLRTSSEMVGIATHAFCSAWFKAAEDVFCRYDQWRFALLALHGPNVYDIVWPLSPVTDMNKLRERFALLLENTNRLFNPTRVYGETAFFDMVRHAAHDLRVHGIYDNIFVEMWTEAQLDKQRQVHMAAMIPGIATYYARDSLDILKSMRAHVETTIRIRMTFAPVDGPMNADTTMLCSDDVDATQPQTNFFVGDMEDAKYVPNALGVDLLRCRGVYGVLDPLRIPPRNLPFHIECRFPKKLIEHIPFFNVPLVCVGKVISDLGKVMHEMGEILLVSCPRVEPNGMKKHHGGNGHNSKVGCDGAGGKRYFLMLAGDEDIEERVILLEVLDMYQGLMGYPITREIQLSTSDLKCRKPWNALNIPRTHAFEPRVHPQPCAVESRRSPETWEFDPRRLRAKPLLQKQSAPEALRASVFNDDIESFSEREDRTKTRQRSAQMKNATASQQRWHLSTAHRNGHGDNGHRNSHEDNGYRNGHPENDHRVDAMRHGDAPFLLGGRDEGVVRQCESDRSTLICKAQGSASFKDVRVDSCDSHGVQLTGENAIHQPVVRDIACNSEACSFAPGAVLDVPETQHTTSAVQFEREDAISKAICDAKHKRISDTKMNKVPETADACGDANAPMVLESVPEEIFLAPGIRDTPSEVRSGSSLEAALEALESALSVPTSATPLKVPGGLDLACASATGALDATGASPARALAPGVERPQLHEVTTASSISVAIPGNARKVRRTEEFRSKGEGKEGRSSLWAALLNDDTFQTESVVPGGHGSDEGAILGPIGAFTPQCPLPKDDTSTTKTICEASVVGQHDRSAHLDAVAIEAAFPPESALPNDGAVGERISFVWDDSAEKPDMAASDGCATLVAWSSNADVSTLCALEAAGVQTTASSVFSAKCLTKKIEHCAEHTTMDSQEGDHVQRASTVGNGCDERTTLCSSASPAQCSHAAGDGRTEGTNESDSSIHPEFPLPKINGSTERVAFASPVAHSDSSLPKGDNIQEVTSASDSTALTRCALDKSHDSNERTTFEGFDACRADSWRSKGESNDDQGERNAARADDATPPRSAFSKIGAGCEGIVFANDASPLEPKFGTDDSNNTHGTWNFSGTSSAQRVPLISNSRAELRADDAALTMGATQNSDIDDCGDGGDGSDERTTAGSCNTIGRKEYTETKSDNVDEHSPFEACNAAQTGVPLKNADKSVVDGASCATDARPTNHILGKEIPFGPCTADQPDCPMAKDSDIHERGCVLDSLHSTSFAYLQKASEVDERPDTSANGVFLVKHVLPLVETVSEGAVRELCNVPDANVLVPKGGDIAARTTRASIDAHPLESFLSTDGESTDRRALSADVHSGAFPLREDNGRPGASISLEDTSPKSNDPDHMVIVSARTIVPLAALSVPSQSEEGLTTVRPCAASNVARDSSDNTAVSPDNVDITIAASSPSSPSAVHTCCSTDDTTQVRQNFGADIAFAEREHHNEKKTVSFGELTATPSAPVWPAAAGQRRRTVGGAMNADACRETTMRAVRQQEDNVVEVADEMHIPSIVESLEQLDDASSKESSGQLDNVLPKGSPPQLCDGLPQEFSLHLDNAPPEKSAHELDNMPLEEFRYHSGDTDNCVDDEAYSKRPRGVWNAGDAHGTVNVSSSDSDDTRKLVGVVSEDTSPQLREKTEGVPADGYRIKESRGEVVDGQEDQCPTAKRTKIDAITSDLVVKSSCLCAGTSNSEGENQRARPSWESYAQHVVVLNCKAGQRGSSPESVLRGDEVSEMGRGGVDGVVVDPDDSSKEENDKETKVSRIHNLGCREQLSTIETTDADNECSSAEEVANVAQRTAWGSGREAEVHATHLETRRTLVKGLVTTPTAKDEKVMDSLQVSDVGRSEERRRTIGVVDECVSTCREIKENKATPHSRETYLRVHADLKTHGDVQHQPSQRCAENVETTLFSEKDVHRHACVDSKDKKLVLTDKPHKQLPLCGASDKKILTSAHTQHPRAYLDTTVRELSADERRSRRQQLKQEILAEYAEQRRKNQIGRPLFAGFFHVGSCPFEDKAQKRRATRQKDQRLPSPSPSRRSSASRRGTSRSRGNVKSVRHTHRKSQLIEILSVSARTKNARFKTADVDKIREMMDAPSNPDDGSRGDKDPTRLSDKKPVAEVNTLRHQCGERPPQVARTTGAAVRSLRRVRTTGDDVPLMHGARQQEPPDTTTRHDSEGMRRVAEKRPMGDNFFSPASLRQMSQPTKHTRTHAPTSYLQ